MSTTRAILAGTTGALAMTVVMALLRAMGMPVNLEMLIGSLLTSTVGTSTWLLGFLIHLALGAMMGILYAAIFQRWTPRANAATGVGIGAVQAMVAGISLGFVPVLRPLVDIMPVPGIFLANLGAGGVIVFIGLHLMFGAIVGTMYAAENRVPTAQAYP